MYPKSGQGNVTALAILLDKILQRKPSTYPATHEDLQNLEETRGHCFMEGIFTEV